jgi:hypothetical protein
VKAALKWSVRKAWDTELVLGDRTYVLHVHRQFRKRRFSWGVELQYAYDNEYVSGGNSLRLYIAKRACERYARWHRREFLRNEAKWAHEDAEQKENAP